jgi:hypothetical protein
MLTAACLSQPRRPLHHSSVLPRQGLASPSLTNISPGGRIPITNRASKRP